MNILSLRNLHISSHFFISNYLVLDVISYTNYKELNQNINIQYSIFNIQYRNSVNTVEQIMFEESHLIQSVRFTDIVPASVYFPNLHDQKKQFIYRFTKEIEHNFKNPNINISDLAQNMYMTDRQLYRKSKIFMNITPNNYLKGYRLDQAIELLRLREPINTVAENIGFSSCSYFCRCFKLEYGMTPTAHLETIILSEYC